MLSPRRWHVGHCASHVFCIFTLPAVMCIFNLAAFQMRIPPLSHEESQLYKQTFVRRGEAGWLGGGGGLVRPPGTTK